MSETKILVAVDFSEACEPILEQAAKQANCSGAHVVLTYAVPSYLQYAANTIPHHFVHELMKELSGEAEKKMAELLPKYFPQGNVTKRILEGYPADVVLQVARDENVDMIVMGSHGHRGFEAALLGSVAEKVIRKSHVPVLVVRPPVTK